MIASDAVQAVGHPRAPGLSVRLMRGLMGAVEGVLRPLVLNRELPPVGRVERDVPYGQHRQQRLDIYVPPGPGPWATLVYVHGGGWVTGDKSNFEWPCRTLAGAGVVVFSINYRWSPEAGFREQVRDVAAAIHSARTHAARLGTDPDAVFLAGDSAGAHLVAWLHVSLGQPALLAAVGLDASPLPRGLLGSLLFYGMYDLERVWAVGGAAVHTPIRCLLGGAPANVPAAAALASPLRHVVPGLAPVFACAGERDPLVAETRALAAALERAGVPCAAVVLGRREYPDAGHSFVNFGRRAATRRALDEAVAFIARARAGSRTSGLV